MKLVVWMLIVFMISSSIVAQSTDEPDISPEEFLAQVNVIRRGFAKNLSIANMHELTWDTNLVQEMLEDVEKDGIINDGGPHAASFEDSYTETLSHIDTRVQDINEFLDSDRRIGRIWDLFFFCPLHKKIGCIYIEPHPFPLQCYMSPKQDPYDKRIYQEVGSPGSKCNDGYANNDGLCSLIGSFTTEAPPTTPEKPTAAPAVADKAPQKQESDTTEGIDQASSSGTILSILQLSTVFFLNIFILF